MVREASFLNACPRAPAPVPAPVPVLFLALILVPCLSSAQDPAARLFASETPLSLRITGPFRELSRVDSERPEHDAVLEMLESDGAGEGIGIEIRVRGNSRLRGCDFPPLSLDFPRELVDGTPFAGQNRLKLVTLCKAGANYVDYLAKEFLIYRMWNELTDRSFRVRWANVEYVYTDSNRARSVATPAFLIEGDWEVAERLALGVIETASLARGSLDVPHTARFALFQFVIGNTDWSVTDGPEGEFCCHNGKVIGGENGPYSVVPYDFDNSGLVNAEYAVPNPILPIRSVTQRLYRGYCSFNDEIAGAVAELNGQRDDLIRILDAEPLSERGRERAIEYLSRSFETINDPRELERQIYGRCLD